MSQRNQFLNVMNNAHRNWEIILVVRDLISPFINVDRHDHLQHCIALPWKLASWSVAALASSYWNLCFFLFVSGSTATLLAYLALSCLSSMIPCSSPKYDTQSLTFDINEDRCLTSLYLYSGNTPWVIRSLTAASFVAMCHLSATCRVEKSKSPAILFYH